MNERFAAVWKELSTALDDTDVSRDDYVAALEEMKED